MPPTSILLRSTSISGSGLKLRTSVFLRPASLFFATLADVQMQLQTLDDREGQVTVVHEQSLLASLVSCISERDRTIYKNVFTE